MSNRPSLLFLKFFSMSEVLSENPHHAIEDLKKRIHDVRKRLTTDGDLLLLDLETLTNEDVELWKDYEKFIDLLTLAVEKHDLTDLKGAVEYLYDKVKSAKSSLFTSFIANRLTGIKGWCDMIGLNRFEHNAPSLWNSIKEQLEFQRKNILSLS
jgi:hypothetical protein